MISGFIAQKRQMTSLFTPDGKRIAVTRCLAKPLVVTNIGDSSIQLAYGQKRRLNQSVKGKLAKIKLAISPKGFKEFKKISDQPLNLGDQLTIDKVFKEGDIVNVTGTSKGHGFAGVIKRWGFHRQPVTGGQSDRVRAPGAIGAQTPGKVIKGKKMPGHYGNVTKTVTYLKIISLEPETNEILVSGSIPGHFNSWVTITKRNS